MGAAMAARLHEMGEEVTVWNRSREKAEASGLPIADTLHALCERSDIIITSLFDDSAAVAVYCGDEGLLAAGCGKLFIEMSTLSPATQTLFFEAARRGGAAFIECPVGGTTGPARSGQLLGLVGGEIGDLERARPVLQMLCRRIERMGAVGSGALTKLAINLPLLVFWQSFGEALALVRGLGKDPAWLVQLFSETAGAPNVLKVKAAAVAATLAGDQHVAATFAIDAMCKDLRTMLAEGEERGLLLPLASQTLSVLNDISAAGLGDCDCSYVPAYWAASERNRGY
ncbi:3-hydroxyisobutyrate dehydrogenase [Paraburkholderia silvatlantica]|uniref:3-hydroxyisobutyrate dehydrogenase n=2 Tax=Paraburkholderia silvatlantica TaxID=321895 RepID=A0ABR6FWY5_9BURK|nr:3-hydroxyisobutyrate dehydrogenase [Paraburkholderia silvatlantica]PVY24619.1 3-hydroxyisobutyrate dehydrogenase [Paraburkholderia silvatlantica]PXW31115.1 3-hydroxyisobutyrate dehydrogenase [Paraburkholderia silvatlantica]